MSKFRIKIKKALCWLAMHNWQPGLSGDVLSPVADKCKWCKLVRVFHGWGYTYGRDANDQ